MEQQKKEALDRIEAEKAEREAKKKKSVSSQLLMSAEEAAKANVGWKTIVKDEAVKEEGVKKGGVGGSEGGKGAAKATLPDLYEAPLVDDSEAPPLE